MTALATLIRLHRRELDVRRRRLAFLEARLESLRGALDGLAARLTAEQAAARESEVAGFAYGDYARKYLRDRAALKQQIAKAEGEVAKAREAVFEALSETKKYEIAADLRGRREAAEAARREQIELDSVGITMFRRRTS